MFLGEGEIGEHGQAVRFGKLTAFGVDLPEAVVAQLVHEAVVEGGAALGVDAELSGRRVVIMLLDVGALLRAAADPDHPQKLVDVYGGEKD